MGNYCNLFFLKKSLFFSSGYWASNICLLQSKLLFYQKWLPFPIVLKRNEATHLLFLARLCCHCCWQEPVPSFWCFKRTTCSLSALRRKSSQSENEQFKTTLFGGGVGGVGVVVGGHRGGWAVLVFPATAIGNLKNKQTTATTTKQHKVLDLNTAFHWGQEGGKSRSTPYGRKIQTVWICCSTYKQNGIFDRGVNHNLGNENLCISTQCRSGEIRQPWTSWAMEKS